MRRLVVSTAALLAALVVPTGAASAHAELLSMTPQNGASLAKAPTEVVLKYSEAIGTTGSEVVVTSPSGRTVSTGAPDIVDGVVTQKLGPMTEAGGYRIVARVISEDGHPVTAAGAFVMTTGTKVTVTAPPIRPASPAQVSATNSNAAASVTAVLLLIAAALGIAIAQRRKSESAPEATATQRRKAGSVPEATVAQRRTPESAREARTGRRRTPESAREATAGDRAKPSRPGKGAGK